MISNQQLHSTKFRFKNNNYLIKIKWTKNTVKLNALNFQFRVQITLIQHQNWSFQHQFWGLVSVIWTLNWKLQPFKFIYKKKIWKSSK